MNLVNLGVKSAKVEVSHVDSDVIFCPTSVLCTYLKLSCLLFTKVMYSALETFF